MWPWTKTEKRSSGYTDLVVQGLLAQSANTISDPTRTAAVEAAAGFFGNCFVAADLEGDPRIIQALSAEVRAMIGYTLARRGEIVLYPELIGTRWNLQGVARHEIRGKGSAASYRYDLTLSAPDGHVLIRGLSPEAVIHLTWMIDPQRPWKGLAPHMAASESGRLLAGVTTDLADESQSARGHVLPVPSSSSQTEGSDESEPLKQKFAALKGRLLTQRVPINDAMPERTVMAKPSDWSPSRIGPAPTEALVELHRDAAASVLSAFGPGIDDLLGSGTNAASMRESYRIAVAACVVPLAKRVSERVSEALEGEIKFDFKKLASVDVAARVRGLKGLVDSGVDLAAAREAAGI